MVTTKIKVYQFKLKQRLAMTSEELEHERLNTTSQLIRIAFNLFEMLNIVWSFNFRSIGFVDGITAGISKIIPS